jgi:chemotaxis protein MotB
MAAGGGGAWKVAYADFVTAMMAFFLVMWICGQDQAIRKAVSYYFNDPMNSSMIGHTKQPSRTGSIADLDPHGSVPMSESVALGRGRKSHTPKGEKAGATKMVSDWLNWDPKTRKYWEEQAQDQRKWAGEAKEVREKKTSPEEAAALKLAKSLRGEVGQEIIVNTKGLQQDLLFEIMSQVNWLEIAEDLLSR